MTDAPEDAPRQLTVDQVVSELRDPATGALTGWLAIEAGELVHTDLLFRNPLLIRIDGTGAVGSAKYIARLHAGRVLLAIGAGKIDGLGLYVYDPAADSLVAVATLSERTTVGVACADDKNVYVALLGSDDVGSVETDPWYLYRVSLDASESGAAIRMAREYISAESPQLVASREHIVYSHQGAIKAVAKTAVSDQPGETLLAPPPSNSTSNATSYTVMAAAQELIYFQEGSVAARVISERGESVAQYPDAQWWFITDTTSHHELAQEPDRIGLWTGGIVESFSAATHSDRTMHGVSPGAAIMNSTFRTISSVGARHHLFIQGSTNPPYNGAQYLIDLARPNSLGKVTKVDASYWELAGSPGADAGL
jgi:hypothetical protein